MLQSGNLIPFLTAAENVELAMELGARTTGARRGPGSLLGELGLADRADHLPRRMSGGEAQRVSVAVALANEPDLLLADEVTGELDSASAEQVMTVIFDAWRARGLTVLFVTHSRELAARAQPTAAPRERRRSGVTRAREPRRRASALDSVVQALRDAGRRRSARSTGSHSTWTPGSSLAITGPSGCGKSTLLGLIGGLEAADRGPGRDRRPRGLELPERQRARLRREELGFVFQSDNLLPFLTAVENVAPASSRCNRRRDRRGTSVRRAPSPSSGLAG